MIIIEEDGTPPPPLADSARYGGSENYADADTDDFALDPHCFDIVPSTPDLTRSHSEDEGSSFADAPPPLPPAPEEGKSSEEVDDFAELEAWLNSGAVEIVN